MGMSGDLTGRGRSVLALMLTMLVLAVTAGCSTMSAADSSSGSGGSSAVVSTAPSASGPQKVCGTPPCVRFLSRGDTKTLSGTLTDHPVISAVAVHLAVGVLCGGILCLLGEGVSTTYVEHATKDAADQHACLKVSVLPDERQWKLVGLSASNESPYCTN